MTRVRVSSSPLLTDAGEGFCLAICHDLRGPLATADAALGELARTLSAPADAVSSRHLEIARRSLSKADRLLASLPVLLAHDPPPVRPVRLTALVEEVRDDLEVELERCAGALHVLGTLPRVLGDEARLRIALRNLVQNSIRHRRAGAAPRIVVRAWLRSRWCTLTIADNGRGLVPRRDASASGLGLGIAIARRAIESSGGHLSFATRPGRGTTAAVTLPAVEEPGDAPAEDERSTDAVGALKRTAARANRPSTDSARPASPAASNGRSRRCGPARDRG